MLCKVSNYRTAGLPAARAMTEIKGGRSACQIEPHRAAQAASLHRFGLLAKPRSAPYQHRIARSPASEGSWPHECGREPTVRFAPLVVLQDPAVGDLKAPAVHLLLPICRHDARWLSGFEDNDDVIRLGTAEGGSQIRRGGPFGSEPRDQLVTAGSATPMPSKKLGAERPSYAGGCASKT
jgi:hypothetical protein